MNKCNIFKRVIAMLIVATLIVQGNYVKINAENTQTNSEKIIYYDGVAFNITESKECILVTAKYENEELEMLYYKDDTADATITKGIFTETNYELDVDIDKTEDLNIDVYENGELIETLDDDITYEGQCTLVAAGSATYWLFSAAVSAVITYKAYNIVTSSSKSNNNAKSRQPGQPIDKSKAPGSRKNNKNVKKKMVVYL